jgi:hypothetical protein
MRRRQAPHARRDIPGEHFDADRLAEVDDRGDDRAVAGVGEEACDEGPVDLDDVRPQLLQVAERGVAGAEVVDRDADPEPAQRLEAFDRRLHVARERALGHLERQQSGIERGVDEDPFDHGVKPRVVELPAGDVDRHVQRPAAPRRGGGDDLAGLFEYPRADGDDQAARLRDRDELLRHDQALVRVLPSQERLGTAHLAALQLHDRLEMHPQVAVLEGPAECTRHLHPADGALLVGGTEQRHTVATVPARRAHRELGVADNPIGVALARLDPGDADARRDIGLGAADDHRLGEHPGGAIGDRHRHVRHRDGLLVDELGDEHELVAPDSCENVVRTGEPPEALGGGKNELVDRARAVRAGVQLELVDLDEEHDEPSLGAPAEREENREALAEHAPVGETGDRVVEGGAVESVPRLPLFGDVVGIEHDARDGRVVEEICQRCRHPSPGAVGRRDPQIEVDRGPGTAEQSLPGLLEAPTIVGVDAGRAVLRDALIRRHP